MNALMNLMTKPSCIYTLYRVVDLCKGLITYIYLKILNAIFVKIVKVFKVINVFKKSSGQPVRCFWSSIEIKGVLCSPELREMYFIGRQIVIQNILGRGCVCNHWIQQ